MLPRHVKASTPMESPKSPSSSEIMSLVRSNKEVLQSIQSLKDDIETLRRCVTRMEAKVEGVESTLVTLLERQSKCEEDIKNIKSTIGDIMTTQSNLASNILQEVEERERRRNNIMIFGLPEKEDGPLNDRRDCDMSATLQLFDEADVKNVSPVWSRRVGRISEGKVRPLKVVLQNQADKQEVLRKGRNLRDSTSFKKVFVTNDATRMQQAEMQLLRSELKRKRDLGEDVVIYNNQIRTRESIKNFRH